MPGAGSRLCMCSQSTSSSVRLKAEKTYENLKYPHWELKFSGGKTGGKKSSFLIHCNDMQKKRQLTTEGVAERAVTL